MSWKSYQKKLFNFADKNDEWDPEAEDRWNQQTQVLMQEHPERFDENGNMKIGVVDDTMPIRNMRTGEIMTPTAQQGDMSPAYDKFASYVDEASHARTNPFEAMKLVGRGISDIITGIDPNADKALLTEEQKVNYANNNLANLSDENKTKLREFVELQDELDKLKFSLSTNNNDVLNSSISEKSARAKQLNDELRGDLNIDNDTFNKYVSASSYLKNLEERKQQQEELANEDSVIGENVGAVLNSTIRPITSAIGYLYDYSNPYRDENYDVDHNSFWFNPANYNKDVTQETTKRINESTDSDVGKFALNTLYQGGKSGLESLLRIGTMGEVGSIASAGIEAYDNAREEAQERGLSKTQAIETAVAQGMSEAMFEVLPTENLFKLFKEGSKGGIKGAIKEIAKQGAFEGLEEVETDLTNMLTDALINKDKSEFNVSMQEKINNGADEKDAFMDTLKEKGVDVVQSFLGGAIGGLGGGAVAVGGSTVANAQNKKALDGNYDTVAKSISDNVADYNTEEDYNKAMEVKAKAEELSTQDNVSSHDRNELLQGIQELDSMDGSNLIETINENINSPFTDVGGFSVVKNNMTSQDVAQTMAEASKSNDVNLFVEAYRDSQASQDLQARQTGQQYFDTLSPKFDSYDTGDQNLQTALSLRSAEDIYTAAKNGEEINDYEINTQRKQEALQSGIIERTQYLAQQQQAKVQEENRTINPKKIETKQGTFNARDLSYNEKTDTFTVTKNGEEIEIPKKDISNRAMQTFVTNAYEQPTASATQLYIESYDASVPIGSYNQAFNSAITAGAQQGYSFDAWLNNHKYYTKALSKKTLKKIFDEGAQEKKTSGKKKNKAEGKVNIAPNVQIDNDDIFIQMTKAYAKKAKIDVEITEQGLKVGDKYARGALQPSIEKLTLAKNNDAKLQTFFHEGVGEFLQAYNPEDMKAIQASILEYLRDTKGEDWVTNSINRYMKRYKSADYNTVREAANELVNDSIAGFMTTDKGIEDFMNWAAKEDKTLLDKIKDFLNALVEKIHDLIENGGLEEASLATAKMTEKKAKELRQRIFDAMDKAIEGSSTTTEQIEEPKAASYESRQSFDSLEDKARFDLGEPVEKKGNLIAVHNMFDDELLKTLELGGFPMPSVAIIKASQGHTKYGNVSIVFYADTIDPANPNNRVWLGDAYTPDFSSISIDYKLNTDKLNKVAEKVKKLCGEVYDSFINVGLDDTNIGRRIKSAGGDIVKACQGNEALEYAFVKSRGIKTDIPLKEKTLSTSFNNNVVAEVAKYVDVTDAAIRDYVSYEQAQEKGVIDKIIDTINADKKQRMKNKKLYEALKTKELPYNKYESLMHGVVKYHREGITQEPDRLELNSKVTTYVNNHQKDYDKWIKNLFKGVIEKKGIRNDVDEVTDNGRRDWEELHYDFNLDNLVETMRNGVASGKAMLGYSFMGSATEEVDSIDDIRNAEDRLQLIDDEEYDNLKKEIQDDLYEVARQINRDTGYDVSSVESDIAEAVANNETEEDIRDWLSQWYTVTDIDMEDIMSLRKRVRSLPTGYFEAKPQRAVTFDEIAKVILPENTNKDVINALEERNIPYETYLAGNKEDRLNKLNAVEDVRFSLAIEGKSDAEIDQEYMDAVEAEDMETLNRMVREYASMKLKDSKARLENGELRELYHGTNKGDFTIFDKSWLGSASGDRGFFGEGFYFAFNESEARIYGKKVIKAFLNATNPYYFNELYRYNEARTRDGEGEVENFIFHINFANKFPELYKGNKVFVYDVNDNPIEKDIKELQKEFDNIIRNVEFVVEKEHSDYDNQDYYVAKAGKEHFSEDGYEWDEYKYEKKFARKKDAEDVLTNAFYYLTEVNYSDIHMKESTNIILESDFANALKDRGYDSVFQSENGDEAVVFNSEQIKSSDPITYDDNGDIIPLSERFNTDNEDVRFSFDVDTRYDLIGVDELTEEELNALFPSDENEKDRSIVDDYKITRDAKDAFISVIKGANKAVDTNITDAQVDDIAERIIKKYSSTKGTQYVANNLRGIFDAMFEYDNYNDIVNALMNLSEEIVETSKAIDPKDQELYDNLLKVIPKFSLTEEQRQEAIYKYGDWGAVFGKIGRFMDKNAPSLDASWSEARDNILSATGHDIGEFANTNNQVDEIIEALDLYRPRSRNMYAGADTTDVALTTAMEIMQDFYSTAMTEKDTSASVKRSLNKQMNDYKKQVEQDYKERLKEAKKEYKEKNDELKRLFGENSKHVADMERLMRRAERKAQRGRDSLSRYKERQERTRRLNSIKRSGTRLMRMIEKPSKNKYVPDILKKPIIDMVTSIDFMTRKKDGTLYRENSNTNRMWREKFNSMQDILSQLSDVAMSDITGRQPKIMRDKSVAQRNEIYNIATHVNGIVKTFFDTFYDSAKDKQVSIYGLNNEELYSLDQFLKSLSAVANNAPTLLKNASFASVDELANKSLQEIHELKTLDRTKGGFRAFAMSLNEPITYFEKLGKAPRSIYNEFLEGELLYLQRIREAGDAFEEKKKDMKLNNSEVRKWDKDIRDFEVEGEGTLRLNIPQVMYMYALYPREQAKYHFLLGGVTAKELEIDLANKRKNKSYKRQVKPIRLNGEDVERITSILTPQQKELADYMVKYLSTTVSGWGNNVSQAQYGIDTFTEPHYMPITSDPNNIKTNVNNANQNVNIWSLQNKGFTKETVERASNPIMIDDIFNVFTNHIAEMAQYEGFVLPIQDAMRFYNYETEDATTQDATIKAAINRVMGDAGKEYFTRFIEDANRSNRTYNDLDKINKFLSRNKAQAVMANSRVVIQQPTAYLRAGEVIEEKYLAKSVALTAVHLKKYADLSKEHSPLSWYKSKGYYDVMIGQDLQELITGKATISEKINDFMGAPAGIADDLTWGMLYRASMLKVEDSKAYKDGKLKKDSDEYFDAVNDIFHEIIIKTQVVDTFLTKSQIMRNQEIGHKLATSFMAEPIKSFNMLNRGVWDWAQGKSKKKLAKAIAVYGVTNILVGVVTSMVDAWRDNDEDKPFSDRFLNKWLGIEDFQNAKNPWDYVKAVWGANAFDSLNPINMIPVVKEVSSAIMGYDNANMSTAFIYQALDLAKSFVNGSSTKTAYGYIYNTAQVVSLMTGVPVANVMRESKDLYNNLNDLWGGENIVKSTKNTGVNDKIFKAFDEGGDYKAEIDERKQELIEYYLSEDKTQAEAEKQAQSTITSAITSQYKPQLVELYKTDINQANLLKQRLIDMNVAAGKTRDKANKDINKWVK